MKSKTPKHYLPRAQVSADTLIAIDEIAKDSKDYIGTTLERLLLESKTLNVKLDELRRVTPWMEDHMGTE